MSCPSGRRSLQQPPSFSRGGRCLYCQQHGCPGIQSCWWPRIRRPTPTSSSSDLRERVDKLEQCFCSCGGKSALEENLQAQVRILEHEVRLLRSRSGSIAATASRGKRLDASTMTPQLHLADGHPSLVELAEGPPPTIINTPSSFLGLQLQQDAHRAPPPPDCLNQEQKASDAEVAHVSNLTASPSTQEMALSQRIEGLEHLVRELATKNAALCRNLAETRGALEQREKLLRSVFVEPSAAGDAPVLGTPQAFSPPPLPMQLYTSMTQQLMQTQEEVVERPSEEIRQTEYAVASSKAKMHCSAAKAEEFQFHAEMPTLLPRGNEDTARLLDVTSANTTHPCAVSDADLPEASSADPLALAVKNRVLCEQLASAERKLLAWETWYRQQRDLNPLETHESQKRETAPCFSIPTPTATATPLPPPGERASTASTQTPQQQEALRALPFGGPARCVGLQGFSQWRDGSTTDALAMETYALMEREAALRRAAAQERVHLTAALMMDGRWPQHD